MTAKNFAVTALILSTVVLTGVVNPLKLAAAEAVNQFCPVSGDSVNSNGKFSYDYQGKTYGFCCLKCVKAFKKNPGKYLSATARH